MHISWGRSCGEACGNNITIKGQTYFIEKCARLQLAFCWLCFQIIQEKWPFFAVPTNQTALFAKDGKETCADQLQFCITSIVLRREKAFREELKITSSNSVLVERSHVGSLLVMCRCYQKLPKVKLHEVRNDKQQKDLSLNGELAKQVTTQHAYIDRLRVNNNN